MKRLNGFVLTAAMLCAFATGSRGAGIINGNFNLGPDGLAGWQTSGGAVTTGGGAAFMHDYTPTPPADHSTTTLSQLFTVPTDLNSGNSTLQFSVWLQTQPGPGIGSSPEGDEFFAHLYYTDASGNKTTSVFQTVPGPSSAFFQVYNFSPPVPAIGDPSLISVGFIGDRMIVNSDLSQAGLNPYDLAGKQLLLEFDLIGVDDKLQTDARVSQVRLVSSAPLPPAGWGVLPALVVVVACARRFSRVACAV